MARLSPPLWILIFATAAFGAPPAKVDFDTQIKPILSDRCFFCHGPDAANRKAELRLDREETAKEYAIVPGDPEDSELFLRITHENPKDRMPPAKSKLSLSNHEIALIRQWIEQGAEWQEHWAFVSPVEAPVPDVSSAWPANEIDRFILSRLQREGLAPSPEASRERLIRRLSFDLTGLPPTLKQIDDFLADNSPEAYEKVVDSLLDSPKFGERMAAEWLDVARYSDTYGYQVDRDRFVWPWRDWVVRALNENTPYDRFITLQLAGDLLPDATDDQILATTFNRLHPQKVEGGSTPEEFRIEYVADRNQTFATALLGLTMECSRCHDHKYDPISQKEYYQLSAFFDNIDEAGLYSYFTQSVPTPTLRIADDAAKANIAKIEKQILEAEQKQSAIAESRKEAFAEWARNTNSLVDPVPTGRIKHLTFEDQKNGANKAVPGKVGKAVLLSGDDGIGTGVGNFRRFEPFSVALWLNTPVEKERAVVFHRSRAWTDAGSRGYQLLIEHGRLSASLIHFWPGNSISVRTTQKIPTKQWMQVVVTYDGSSRANGLKIQINGTPAEIEVVRDNLYKNITGGGGDHITIGERFRDRGFTGGMVDEFQVYNRQLTSIEVAQIHDGAALTTAIEKPLEDLTDKQRGELFANYLANVDPEFKAHLATLRSLREQRSKTVDGIREIMVMREMPEPRSTYLLLRGAYDQRGEQVSPETPAALPAFPTGAPRNRLGLVRWLTDPEHPLTARVAVNRYWQMLMGEGLVRTPEDFGSQGKSPTHPQLLDWLARDFIKHGWHVKRLLKQIAMSATYRQSSAVTSTLLKRDPENLLWARASSHRLSAEMLRDNALAVSGLLVARIGGPPAKPYEVEVSFKPAKRDRGDGLYRRSLYTYWKRTGPAPVMMTLDAAKRDVCRVKRERTSSPLQALVLLNGPQFVEAARVLSQKLIQQHGDDADAIFVDLFRTLTSRRPTSAELEILRSLYEKQLAYFKKDASRAGEFLKVGDAARDAKIAPTRLAAMTAVANALMSFDDSVMRR